MSRSKSSTDYFANTPAHLARELGVDRSTVVRWIGNGTIKHFLKKKKKGDKTRICESEFNKRVLDRLRPPTVRHHKYFTEAEKHTIKMNVHLPRKKLAEMLKRNENSIKIMICRLRKAGEIR